MEYIFYILCIVFFTPIIFSVLFVFIDILIMFTICICGCIGNMWYNVFILFIWNEHIKPIWIWFNHNKKKEIT